MPVPLVSVRNSSRYPIRVRAGTENSMPHPALAVVDQVDHLSLAKGELFRDHAEKPLFAVDQQPLDGFEPARRFHPGR